MFRGHILGEEISPKQLRFNSLAWLNRGINVPLASVQVRNTVNINLRYQWVILIAPLGVWYLMGDWGRFCESKL